MSRPAGPLRLAIVNRVGPRGGASGRFAGELAGALEDRGWEADLVTAPDSGRRHLAARAAASVRETSELARRARALAPSAVVLMTDPPLLPLAAPALSRHAPVVSWSLDVYPEVASALGVVPVAAAAPLRHAIRHARRRASAVVAIGEAMAARLRAPGVRVETVPLWAPPDVQPRPLDAPRRAALGLGGFVLMYSGTLGRAHPFGALADAAERLRGADVTVVVAGAGARLAAFQAEVERRALHHVQIWPGVPSGDLSERLALADAHVVIQDPRTSGLLVPSKTVGAVASGRPVAVLGPDAEAAALARAAPRSVALAVDDGAGLAAWVRQLQANPPALPLPVPPELPTLADAADAFDRLLRAAVAARRAPLSSASSPLR